MLLGMFTFVMLVSYANADIPIADTGYPLVTLGIVMFAVVPANPVIVMVLLLVTKVNWACTLAGSMNTMRASRQAKITGTLVFIKL